MRTFDTGATRDTDNGKHDPEGFLSPVVIQRFNEYMHRNRYQKDGKIRDSDNWMKGIPLSAYMKSLWRHFLALWLAHRGQPAPEDIEDALCAMLFNVQGYLHELLKAKWAAKDDGVGGYQWKNPLPDPFPGPTPIATSWSTADHWPCIKDLPVFHSICPHVGGCTFVCAVCRWSCAAAVRDADVR